MGKAGFTLIELIMVMIILGILSAIAIPKYIDLQSEARVATADGVLGASASACAINYAAVQTKQNPPVEITGCVLLAGAMDSSGVSITAGSTASQCQFTVGGSDFVFLFTPESAASPCTVAKISANWPTPKP